MLVAAILAGLSVKFSIPLKRGAKIDFDVKGAIVMSVLTAVTSCLAGNAGVCGGCNSGEDGQ